MHSPPTPPAITQEVPFPRSFCAFYKFHSFLKPLVQTGSPGPFTKSCACSRRQDLAAVHESSGWLGLPTGGSLGVVSPLLVGVRSVLWFLLWRKSGWLFLGPTREPAEPASLCRSLVGGILACSLPVPRLKGSLLPGEGLSLHPLLSLLCHLRLSAIRFGSAVTWMRSHLHTSPRTRGCACRLLSI